MASIIKRKKNYSIVYNYDAWGKPTLVRTLTAAYEALVELNPFRYRGYVYDEETGLYYLKSRYYFPDRLRFVNSDGTFSLWGGVTKLNGYAYCVNSPMISHDPSGRASNDISSRCQEIEAEIRKYLRIIWGLLQELLHITAESYIPEIKENYPYIPQSVEPKITYSERTIAAEDLMTERRIELLISQIGEVGFLSDVRDWVTADDIQLNPGLHGIIARVMC